MGDAKNPPRRAPGGGADALMARIDRALASWPAAEPSAIERDETVEGIVARAMEEGSGDPSEPDLLLPPLPATREESRSSPSGERGRGGARLWFYAGGIAVATTAAVAAGVVFAIHVRPPPEASSLSTGPRPQAHATNFAASAMSAVPKAELAPPDVPGIDPSDLPLAPAAGAKAVSPPAGAKVAGVGRAAAAVGPAASPDGVDPPLLDDSLRPAAAVGAGSSLAGGPESVPRRPSMGAIQGALGAALPAARTCLGPGAPAYRVTVTFQSDGTVRDVAFPGSASAPQGGAAAPAAPAVTESCVKAALSGVRVPPFAEGAYSVPVTVRY